MTPNAFHRSRAFARQPCHAAGERLIAQAEHRRGAQRGLH